MTTSKCFFSRDKEEDKDKDKRRRRGKRILDKTLKERRSSKTLTEQDIKHIERHLSMKRTIRYNNQINNNVSKMCIFLV